MLEVKKIAGRRNLYIRGSVRGQSVFESSGTSDPEAAETIRVKTEARLLVESIHGKKALIKFHEAADSYTSTGAPHRFILDRRADGRACGLAVYFRGKFLKDITQNDLDRAAKELYPAASPETHNRQCHAPFISVWNHAVRNGWAEPRKWSRPRKPKGTNIIRLAKRRSGTHPVDYERAAEFVSAMSPAPAMVMTALFYTGLRPIELFALESDDVNVAKRWLVLRQTKTGEPRGVPMHDFLAPLFTSLTKRGGRVFRTHKGLPYPPTEDFGGQISKAIDGARARLAKRGIVIRDVSPYTGRHTVSTQLVINGVHPHIKDQILGHAVDDMSRHYTNVPQAPLIKAINTLPVPEAWRGMEWWSDPLAMSKRFVKWGDPAKRKETKVA